MDREQELREALREEEEEEYEEKEYEEEPSGKKVNFLRRGPVIGKGKLKVRLNIGLLILIIGTGLFAGFYLFPLWFGS